MSHQTNTGAAWKRATAARLLAVPLAVGATALGVAAPAAATDSNAYLQALQPRYQFLSESQLMSAGSKVCAATHSGMPASDAVGIVSKDLGVSVSAGYEIVVNAINYLGC